MKMKWIPEYNTGIDVIDDQHKRILDYINEIVEISDHTDKDRIKQILDNIIDYTQSHFTFEESLQEEADYKYRVPHKRVHDLFIKKIESYRDRFQMGHSIEAELHEVLSKWLINHIQHDDADYVGAVKENMMGIIKEKEQKRGKNWFARFFS
ncbi:bacteriohemerythrin [Acinetobacter portensis]|uniref:Bacteriohemerythrin n=2 Tax=Acinetobacter TaxID=469 RepID=A0A6L6GDI7_9GAMM|nr:MULTISPECIES: bacteriohemerythrin [Acinetobacter]MCK7609399.1 bacteriohemerythrin [Acinetobacter portensis]MCK7640173.1 bacteriohemerythrin [Acinetobacter portensis]MDY6451470.1 bacteriohemerythrin [Acinetobacter faecalis]MDY6457998.1 bacteriohemerythrin [Acinetobacter faecalis]MDY6459024.1 bacteriohemerythrin [Acinetobacter faecalis]